MDNNSARKIWEQPWGYTEGFVVASGVAFSGYTLQFILGGIVPSAFAGPVNSIAAAFFVVVILATHILFKEYAAIRWLAGAKATIAALTVLLIMSVILGLTPQVPDTMPANHIPRNLYGLLGFYRMTTSWPFVFTCLYVLFILGLTILGRTRRRFTWRDVGFYLNHLGLFVALLAGLFGSSDLQRLRMTVNEGTTEWRAADTNGHTHELPLAIQLDSFIIEEYPPKLVIIDNIEGRMQPEGRPENYQFDAIGGKATLAGYSLEILDYLPNAGVVRDTNFVNFVPLLMDGATTALKVRVTAPTLNEPVEGWVSNGSYMFPYQVLYIDSRYSMAMPVQDVKKYTSKVTTYTKDGLTRKADIEVNKPLSIGGWKIYQLSYDQSKGKYSETSIFELVRDPWIDIVYIGIFMMLAGALYLFIAGPNTSSQQKKKTS